MNSEYHHSYILDPENAAEMARLEIQSQFLTEGMGGLLPELKQTLPPDCSRALDLGCGPGEWVRQMAATYPKLQVTGLDISQTMLAYAQALAQEKHLDNAHFVWGNLLKPLNFPPGSFDLVNARLLVGVLQRESWPNFLQECGRLLRSGGWLRLVENSDPTWQTNKPASEKMNSWALEAGTRSGYGFATATVPDWRMDLALQGFLTEAGWSDIAVHQYLLDGSFGAPFYDNLRRNMQIVWKQSEALLLRLGITTEAEFTQTYDAMKKEMAEKDFQGVWRLCTTLARKSEQ